jgi:hypothetical protein
MISKDNKIRGIELDHKALYSELPSSNLSQNIELWPINFKNHHKETMQDEINLYGFRSDEFIKVHNQTHVLFMGCSYTWGTGLYIEETWAKTLHSKINSITDTSGYFNIGVPGDSIFASIINAFKYFKNFGNPDVIFFNIQDLNRFYDADSKNNKIFRSIYKNDWVLPLLAYQYYYMLDQYCSSNNIKLFSSTWIENRSTYILNSFKSFYPMDFDDINKYVIEYHLSNSEDSFALLSRDNAHLGTAYHKYWANFLYSKYDINSNLDKQL